MLAEESPVEAQVDVFWIQPIDALDATGDGVDCVVCVCRDRGCGVSEGCLHIDQDGCCVVFVLDVVWSDSDDGKQCKAENGDS